MASYDGRQHTTFLNCPLCVFHAPNIRLVLSHLRLVHSSDPRFSVMCGIGGCSTTSKSFSALYQHIYKKHKDSGIIQPRIHRTFQQSICADGPELFSADVNSQEVFQEGLYLAKYFIHSYGA